MADGGVLEDAVCAVLQYCEYVFDSSLVSPACLPFHPGIWGSRRVEATDIRRVGQVTGFNLLRHGCPDVHPVIVACCYRDTGRAQHEAEEKSSKSGVRHVGEQRDVPNTAFDSPSRLELPTGWDMLYIPGEEAGTSRTGSSRVEGCCRSGVR